MRRYWVPSHSINANSVEFTGDIYHHIFDVCRQQVGSKFEVLAGDQKAHFVEVTTVAKKSASAQILETRIIPPLKKPWIHLALSVSRYQVMDAIVEKAVEMGVHSIHPFYSDFSFIKSSLPAGKLERWEKIVISATQQSGRGELLKIHPPQALEMLLGQINQNGRQLGLFAYEGEASQDIASYLRSKKAALPETLNELWLIVGSEGGFSQTEVQSLGEAGLDSVTIGEQVLRVETACIALLAVLKYEFDLMR